MDARGFWRPWRAARGQSDFALPRVTEVTLRPTQTHRSLPSLVGVPPGGVVTGVCRSEGHGVSQEAALQRRLRGYPLSQGRALFSRSEGP